MGARTRYFIRESFCEGTHWKSRNLFDLGEDPSVWVHYPGGVSYFIDETVEDALCVKEVVFSQEDLEKVFFSFLSPEVRVAIGRFSPRKPKGRSQRIDKEKLAHLQKGIPLFDKMRLYFLRYGPFDPRKIARYSLPLYNHLLRKSRDEIEQQFLEMEQRLEPSKRKMYVYSVFNLQKHFSSPLASRFPQAMEPEQMDRAFLEEVCRIYEDPGLFPEAEISDGLHPSLVRYVIMYFDHEFFVPDFGSAYAEDFMHRHRAHRSPPKRGPDLSVDEACSILAIEKSAYPRLSKRDLAQVYRKRALDCHPDQGGSHERFIRLTNAYKILLLAKARYK